MTVITLICLASDSYYIIPYKKIFQSAMVNCRGVQSLEICNGYEVKKYNKSTSRRP